MCSHVFVMYSLQCFLCFSLAEKERAGFLAYVYMPALKAFVLITCTIRKDSDGRAQMFIYTKGTGHNASIDFLMTLLKCKK